MGLSLWHLLVVLLIVLVLFGSRLPQVMGDLGKGLRSFKSGLNNDDKDEKMTAEKPEPAKLSSSDDTPKP